MENVYNLEIEVSLKEVVQIEAKSEEEARDILLNDVQEYAELGNFVDNEYYNGIVNIKEAE